MPKTLYCAALASRPRNLRRRRQTFVESAFIIIVLLATVLFVIDIGRGLATQQWTSKRARLATRNASSYGCDQTAVANFVAYPTTTGSGADGYFGVNPSQVTLTTLGTAGAPNQRLQVTIQGIQVFAMTPLASEMRQKRTTLNTNPGAAQMPVG